MRDMYGQLCFVSRSIIVVFITDMNLLFYPNRVSDNYYFNMSLQPVQVTK